MIGEAVGGIPEKDWLDQSAKFAEAYDGFQKLRSAGTVGFVDIVNDDDLPDSLASFLLSIGEAFLVLGDLPQAKEHLAVLDKLCFFPCEEYSDLKKAVRDYETSGGRVRPTSSTSN